jgi:hypothetical protein
MRRSEVASKAAEYQRVIDGLAAAAAEVPFSDSDHGVKELSLRLDLLPSMLQYAISSHTGIEQHVQYKFLERMLLQAFGLEKIMPPERYQNLVEFEATLRSHFGDSIIRMLHGQGWAADPTASGKMDPLANAAAVDLSNPVAFIAKHNSGLHSSDTVQRSLYSEPITLLQTSREAHRSTIWSTSSKRRVHATRLSPSRRQALLAQSSSRFVGMIVGRPETRNPTQLVARTLNETRNPTCNPHFPKRETRNPT